MYIDIEEIKVLLMGYIEKHPLVVDSGSEYIMEDGDAQADAVVLVCDIFDNMESGERIPCKCSKLSSRD